MTARIPTLQFECKKHRLRQDEKGIWHITLTVHPNDMPDAVAMHGMGTRYMAVFAEIGEDEQPKKPEAAKQQPVEDKPKQRRPFHLRARSQQAAMKCNDKSFREWLSRRSDWNWTAPMERARDAEDWPEWAACVVRLLCGVASRSELDTNREAGRRWHALLTEYEQATGRVAEDRA